MPHLLRTRLVSITPERIALTVDCHARVQVRGQAYGFVRCAGERRWVWGAFDETFRLWRVEARVSAREPNKGPEIAVSAWGIGGFARHTLQFVGTLDLSVPKPPALRRMRWSAYPSPRLPPLSTQAIRQLCSRADAPTSTD